MGYIVFWLAAAAIGVILFGMIVGLAARIRSRPGAMVVLVLLYLLAPVMALPIGLLIWMQAPLGLDGSHSIPATGALVLILIGAVLLHWRGLRRVQAATPEEPQIRAAARWRKGRLGIAMLAAFAGMATSFLYLDWSVRQEMATVRAEARAMALSVSPAAVADDQNAALLYRQAAEALSHDDADEPWRDRVSAWLEPEDGRFNPRNSKMLAFLARYSGVRDLLHGAGELRECNFGIPYDPPSFGFVAPHHEYMGSLASIASLSARANAHADRADRAMKDLNAIFRLADHYGNEPTLTGVLIAMALQGLAFDTLQDVLAGSPPTAAGLDALKLDLSQSYEAAYARSMKMESATMLGAFCDFNSGGFGPRKNREGRVRGIAASPYRVFMWRHDIATYRYWLDREMELARQPYSLAREQRKQFVDDWEARTLAGILTRLLAPSLVKGYEIAAEADARQQLAVLAVAAWRYRLANNRFPKDLQSLVPDYIPAVPTDPFTGKALKLTARPDGRTVIYSLGPDQTDDTAAAMDYETRKGDIRLILGR